jgi:hypothetical protein
MRRQFHGHGLREIDDPGLGDAVGCASGAALLTRDRRNTDDAAAATARGHGACGGLSANEGAGEIDVQHAPPRIVAVLQERRAVDDAGVVDMNVQSAEALHRMVDGGLCGSGISDIERLEHGSPPVAREGGDGLDGGIRIGIGHHHACALGCEAFGDRPADALGGSGDESDLVFEASCHAMSSEEISP